MKKMVLLILLIKLSKNGECTSGHCYYCDTDGSSIWCSRCGNGKAVSSISGKDRKCSETLTTPFCREADPAMPTDPSTCGRCQRGYYLTKEKKCEKFQKNQNLKNCDIPIMVEEDDQCAGCEKKFLLDTLKGCSDDNTHFPEKCLFGDTIKSKKCKICEHGYQPNISGMVCIEQSVEGCMVYHPEDLGRCY